MKSQWDASKGQFVKCIQSPFRIKKVVSTKSRSISEREADPQVFLRRITPQILEVYDKGLNYSTPEEWDESFNILGGGQSRRTSKTILERLTWSQFLYYFDEIISNNRTN